MVRFTTTVPISQVGTGSKVYTIPVTKGFMSRRIVLIEATHDAGDATHTLVEFSTDTLFADPLKRIATFEGLNKNSPIGHTNCGQFYDWDGSGGELYVRLTPDAEIDNEYTVSVHLVEEVE